MAYLQKSYPRPVQGNLTCLVLILAHYRAHLLRYSLAGYEITVNRENIGLAERQTERVTNCTPLARNCMSGTVGASAVLPIGARGALAPLGKRQ